jgi:hypothetical protein
VLAVTPLFANVVAKLKFAEPLNATEVPVTSPVRAIVRPVCQVVAVPALPEIEPVIVLLKVLTPAQVCAPVVTTPEAVADAVGRVALFPVEEVTIGPAVVPAVIPRLVAGTLTVNVALVF